MKTKHLLLTLLLAVMVPWAAMGQTQTLTVCDGNVANNYIPIAGTYVDTQGTISEFIIPSTTEGMANMVGAAISKLTFYLDDVPSYSWGSPTFQWYMGEVEGTTLSSAYGPSGFSTVATCVLSNQSSTLEVEFDTPYVYNGGNLLIGSYLQTASDWAVIAFSGIRPNNNAAVYHSFNSSTNQEFDLPQQFIPKTTFTYTTCQAPTNLTVNNVTNSSVSLSWTESGSATSWQVDCCNSASFGCDPDYYINVNNTPFCSITQWLSPRTTYYVRVRAVCGNDWYSAWSDPVSFTTLHDPVAVGDSWSDGFEGYSCGWDLINGTQTNQWAWGTATNNGGSKALYISNDGGTTNDFDNSSASVVYAIKQFSFAQGGYYSFEYDWKNHGEGLFGDTGEPTPFDRLRVALAPGSVDLTAGNDLLGPSGVPEGWIALDGGHSLSGQDDWLRNYEETYLQAGTYTMVFVWCNDGSGGRNPVAIDNVSIASVSCPRPTNLTIDVVTTEAVSFTFNTEIGGVYQYCLLKAGLNPANYESLFAGNTTGSASGTEYYVGYPLNGFDFNTEYVVYVRKKCGENEYSAMATAHFTTLDQCAAIPTTSLPYVEDFDSYPYYPANDLPICWSYINTSTGSHTYPQMESGSSHNSSANALSLYSYSYCNENTIFVSDPQPQYAILRGIQDVGRLKMTLWARARSMDNSATVTYDATFKVGVMTDPTDASTFVQIGDPLTPQSTTYEQYTISFDNYTGNGTYIAIMIDPASTISDQPQASHDYHRWVCIDDITVELNCGAPTNVTVSSITTTTATADWVGSPAAQSYTVRYREAIAATPSFSEGFENGLGDWTFYSGNQANDIGSTSSNEPAGIFPSAAHSGDNGFRFSSFQNFVDQGETNASYWQYLTSPEFELSGPSVLRFYHKKYSNLYYESLYVGYITDLDNPQETTFTSPEIHPTEDWQCYILDLPSDAKKVFFSYYGEHTYFVYLDDITIAPAGEWQSVNNIAATTFMLSNLTMDTEYDFQVKSDCSDEWSNTALFTTLSCTASTDVAVSDIMHTTATVSWTGESESYEVEYREVITPAFDHVTYDFEDGTLQGWTTISNDNDNNAWSIQNGYSNAHGGFYYARARYTSSEVGGDANDWLISPQIPLGGSLSFYARRYNTSYPDQFQVYVSTTGNNFSDFTAISDVITPPSSYQLYEYNLSSYSGYGYVAIVYTAPNDQYYIYVDDITINADFAGEYGEWQTVSNATSPQSISSLTPGTTYQVRVKGNCGGTETVYSDVVEFTTLSSNHKLFVTEGYWNDDNNWLPYGAPTVEQDVELRANVTIPSDYVAMAKDIIGYVDYTILIEDGGQLYHDMPATVRLKKQVAGYGQENADSNKGYVLLTFPSLTAELIYQNNFDGSNIRSGVYDLYAWDRLGEDEGNEWINYGSSYPYGMYMDPGKAYLYASQDDRELTIYTKLPGNAIDRASIRLYYTDPTPEAKFSAWHLIGNHFACNAYIVDSQGTTAQPFYKMNAEGNGFVAVTGEAIAPAEGVFFEAPSDAPSNGFNVYFTRTQPTRGRNLNISLSSANTRSNAVVDNAIIRFDEGQTMGKFSFREGSSKVYIPAEGKDLAVAQAEGQVGEIPVNFKAETNGTYTLSFTNEDVEFSYLHLIDNMTGEDVDLLQTQNVIAGEDPQSPAHSYTFQAKTTDYASRFRLLFATVSTASSDTDTFGFINASGNFCIFGMEGVATVQVFDMMGHMLSSETFSGSYEKKINGAPGVYMVRLINGNDVKVQKIVVR